MEKTYVYHKVSNALISGGILKDKEYRYFADLYPALCPGSVSSVCS